MNFNNQILFLFSAIGVFNALLICLYFLFIKKPKELSNYFFGLMLLMLTIRVGKSVFYYFNDDLSKIFLQVGISCCLFIGPSLYFYINHITDPKKESKIHWISQFLILLFLVLLVGIVYPWEVYPELWSFTILDSIYWVWFLYIIASGYLLRASFKKLVDKNQKLNSLEFWLLSVYIGNLLIWIAYRTAPYTSYIVGALTFSFIFYLLYLLVHFSKKKSAIFNPKLKYVDKRIPEFEAEKLSKELFRIVNDKELYKNANLKLSDVATLLNVLPHSLSQLLNDNLNKSFPNYIKEIRIEEAKIQLSKNHSLTLESIGYDCGFNSKSTFYSAFKKYTGMTPAQFANQGQS